jgi:hypothetical protein
LLDRHNGALSGEMLALPRAARERVALFFQSHQQWLTQILKRGAARGEFKLAESAAKIARLFFGNPPLIAAFRFSFACEIACSFICESMGTHGDGSCFDWSGAAAALDVG